MNNEETIKVVGHSGKRSKLSYEELSKKKPNPKLDIYKDKYIIRLTEWYNYDEEFDNLEKASSTIFDIIRKLNKISH